SCRTPLSTPRSGRAIIPPPARRRSQTWRGGLNGSALCAADDLSIGAEMTVNWKNRGAARIALELLMIAATILLPAAAFAQVTAIRAGSFIDTDSGKGLSNQTMRICAGKSEAVGASRP